MQRVTSTPDLEAIALPAIAVVDNLVRERLYSVSFTIPEFTCVCPMTGQPDFATLRVTYVPDRSLIELKALKLYINAYRNVGIFHEFVTNKILNDLVAACQPLRWKSRAILTSAVALKRSSKRHMNAHRQHRVPCGSRQLPLGAGSIAHGCLQIMFSTACRPSSRTARTARCRAGRTSDACVTRSPYPPLAVTRTSKCGDGCNSLQRKVLRLGSPAIGVHAQVGSTYGVPDPVVKDHRQRRQLIGL